MVEWSCIKERLNESGPYIFVKSSCVNKINKSVGTLNSGRITVHIDSAKNPEHEGASYRPTFMGNFQTNSYTFSVLSIQSMGSP